MKKLLIASAIAATSFVAPQAFAQAKNFEGFSLATNLNFANVTSEITSPGLNGSASESSQNLDLVAQYNFALGNSFVLGVGASVGLGELKAGAFSTGNLSVTQKNSYTFYVAPGVALSDSTLLYGKVSALSARFETRVGGNTADGIGFGLGLQNYLNKNLFIQGEVVQNQYNDRTFGTETDKNKSTVVSIGIGYKF